LLLLLVASEALLDRCCGSLVTGDNVAASGHIHPATNIAKMKAAFALFVCVARICLPRTTDVTPLVQRSQCNSRPVSALEKSLIAFRFH
jgi:hypothetical protein